MKTKISSNRMRGADLLAASLLFSLVGCGASSNDSNAVSTAPVLIFEDAWSKTGRFQVHRYADGSISASIVGVIGQDDPDFMGRSVRRSLVDTYRALKPSGAVPAVLAAADEAVRPLWASSTPSEGLELGPETRSDFDASLCHAFPRSAGDFQCDIWLASECAYRDGTFSVNTGANYNSGDASGWWNDSPVQTNHVIYDSLGTKAGFFEAPFSAGFRQVFGFNRQFSGLTEVAGTGNLGLTIHKWRNECKRIRDTCFSTCGGDSECNEECQGDYNQCRAACGL